MIITERIATCRCGEKPYITGGQDPTTLVWRFYVRCEACKDCERGSHTCIESAVAAWNTCSARK